MRPSCSALTAFAALALLLGCALTSGCGGDEGGRRRAKLADQAPSRETDHLHGVRATSEVGGLNEEAVEAVFKSSVGALQRCLNQGSERVEFLGGAVAFFLKIDASGEVEHAHLESSTLGDRATERCMLKALRGLSWPKPVGGEVGLARKSFEFDAPNDVRPPTDWDETEIQPALRKLESALNDCKTGSRGTYQATAYVGADGNVLSAGVTPPDEAGEQAVDCLVDVLEQATFPSPGSWPAKVSFSL